MSCLTTSNLPSFSDLAAAAAWTLHSRFLFSLALYSIALYFHHQSHPQLGVVFALAPSLHSFWSFFSTDLTVAYWAPTNLGSSSFSVLFLPFHTVWVLKARILKWFAIPFSSGPCFVRTLHHDPSILGGPTRHGS